ncbi:MAG: SprT-like domain-containing protein [Prevotella sp.]|nr:SprT-like domain-containing protein [Prevotella sp.]
MICNPGYLRERFDVLNKTCFEGRLPLPRLCIGRSRHMLGTVTCRRERLPGGGARNYGFKLTISAYYDLAEDKLTDTILHEMIHLFILSNHIKDDNPHGQVFRRIMNDLNRRFDRHIFVTNRGELSASGRVEVNNIIGVARLTDGTTCVTRAAKTRIFEIQRRMMLTGKAETIDWYYSSNPFFYRFPRAQKLKFYRIEPDVLRRELEGARRIKLITNG